MNWKTILISSLILLFVPVASANITLLDPTEMAAKAFADGIDMSMIRTGDSIMSFSTTPMNQSDDAALGGIKQTIVGKIVGFASWSIMPFEYHSVQQLMGISFLIGVFLLFLYVLLGAAYCNLSRFTPAGKTFFHIMDGNGSPSLLQNYAQNTVWGCVAMSFSPVMMYLILILAQSLKEMSMMSITEMIVPGDAIPFLYLAMSIMWLLLSLFFGVANMVILLTCAASFLLGAMYASDATRHVAIGWFEYFFGCAMMQPIVVCGVAGVVVIMTEIATKHPLEWAISGIDIPMYLGTIFAATYLAYRLTVSKTKIIRSTTRFMAKVA